MAQHDAAHAEARDVERVDALGAQPLERQGRHQRHSFSDGHERQGVLEAVVGVHARRVAAEQAAYPLDRLGARRVGVDAEPGQPQPADVDHVGGQQGARGHHELPGLVEERYVGGAARRRVALAGVQLDDDAVDRAGPQRPEQLVLLGLDGLDLQPGVAAAPVGQGRQRTLVRNDWKPPIRTVPLTVASSCSRRDRATARARSTSSAASASASPAGVSTLPVGVRWSSAWPVSCSSFASCCDTAEAVTASSSAAASTPPYRATASRNRSRRGSKITLAMLNPE